MRVCLWARSCLGGLSDGRGIRVGIGRGAREKGYLVIDVGKGCFFIVVVFVLRLIVGV